MSTRDVSPLRGLDDCGCCEGVSARTPAGIFNRPGLAEIAYRSGTHSRFLASMLARLTSAELPALQALRTRDSDDFTIALCDAWATVADVISFYQERIANEAFLRTATERRSILELAELIGYQLRPGVAADAVLAFTVEQAPGAPQDAEAIINLTAGLPVQSVPGPDELPQTFETSTSIEARVAWNDLAVQTTETAVPETGTTELYLQGTATLLKAGDPILFVGDDRVTNSASLRWDFRRLTAVLPDEDNDRTLVRWSGGLPSTGQQIPQTDVRIYALRQRAALFGFNAPDPRTLRLDTTSTSGVLTTGTTTTLQWLNFTMPSATIDLDAVYPGIVAGSWMVLAAGASKALVEVSAIVETNRTAYTISNRISRITPDAMPSASTYTLRDTAVYADSRELELAERPLPLPLYGDSIALAARVDGLVPRQQLAIRGARLRLRIPGNVTGLQLEQEDHTLIDLDPGDELQVAAAPLLVAIPGVLEQSLSPDELQYYSGPVYFWYKAFYPALEFRWLLIDRDGRQGTLGVQPTEFTLAPAPDDSELVEEIVSIDADPGAVSADRDRTSLKLAAALANVYDRTTVRINANVAPATHGETVSEVLGSGDASQDYQRFLLRQTPLTHVSAATASGTESTLEVRVNDILWTERPTLYGAGPEERVYTTRLDDDGFTSVQFGDGVNGARLPTGQDNVRATYRKGIGLGGLVRAGKLTQLMSRPLGLKAVTNPHAAEGAEDAESRDQARENAPLTVLTLDRAVSLRDYEDFARAFAGVSKAHAAWIWDGDGNSVLLTVSGPNGATIADSSKVYSDLLQAIAAAGDPTVRIRVKSYRPALFRFAGRIVVDPAFIAERVIEDVEAALRSAFAFDTRAFGQPTMLSEVIAVIQAVEGVVAVDVDSLYRGATPELRPRLIAEFPEVTPSGEILAAELLTLDPAPLDKLEVLT